MVDVHSELADQVVGYLFLASVMGFITARLVHVATIKAMGLRRTRGSLLDDDGVIFGLLCVTSFVALLPAISASSVSYVYDLLAALRQEFSWLGWGFTAIVVMHLMAPFAVAAMLYAGKKRHPRPVRYGL